MKLQKKTRKIIETSLRRHKKPEFLGRGLAMSDLRKKHLTEETSRVKGVVFSTPASLNARAIAPKTKNQGKRGRRQRRKQAKLVRQGKEK